MKNIEEYFFHLKLELRRNFCGMTKIDRQYDLTVKIYYSVSMERSVTFYHFITIELFYKENSTLRMQEAS